MAITIISIPSKFTPVYNDVFFEASSDNTAEVGFNYVFDLYFNDVFQTRHRIPSRPVDGNGLFNAMRIIESQLSSDTLTDLTSTFKTNNAFWQKVNVKIGEEYEVSGVSTVFPDLETTDYIYATNSVFDYLDYIDYLQADYLLLNSTKRFLTNAPQDQKIRTGENAWLYSMNDVPLDYDRRQVKTYNSSGTLLNTFNYNNTSLNADTDANKFLRCTAGPAQIVSEHGGTAMDNVASYTVQAQKSDGTAISEAKRYLIDNNCTKYTPVRIHFLNKYGAFDSFTFKLISKKDFAVKTTSFQKAYGNSKATSDRLIAVSNTTITDGLNLISDYVGEAEHKWLTELITSPIIFQELNGRLIALKCVETKYTEKKKINEKLFNLNLNFDYTFINNRQRY